MLYALYRFRTSDRAGQALADLNSSLLKNIRIGRLDVGLEFPKFAPSQHLVESRITAAYNLQPITTRLDLGASYQNEKVQDAQGTAGIAIPVGRGKLDLGVDFGAAKALSFNATATVPAGPVRDDEFRHRGGGYERASSILAGPANK